MNSQMVMVAADDNIINNVRTTISNNRLTVDLAPGSYNDVSIEVAISVPLVTALQNTGSGNIDMTGFSDLNSIEVNNEGSGAIRLGGSASMLSLRNTGSGNYKGYDFTVENCTDHNTGSGNCEIPCAAELSVANS